MNLLFLDTETTGLKDPYLVQLAYIHSRGHKCSKLFKPLVPIEEGASKVTGIYDKDVAEYGPFDESSIDYRLLQKCLPDSIFIAHNARFDMNVLDREGLTVVKYLCTMKVARVEMPIEPNHKLESLFLSLGLSAPDGGEIKAHDAMGDIIMMRELLRYMTVEYLLKHPEASAEDAIEYFVDISMNPLLKTMPFGKYKGWKMGQLPPDYIDWIKQKPDFDSDVLHTINTLKL